MTIDELEELVHTLIPGAALDFDNDNQIIIYTNLMLKDNDDQDSELVDFDPDAGESGYSDATADDIDESDDVTT